MANSFLKKLYMKFILILILFIGIAFKTDAQSHLLFAVIDSTGKKGFADSSGRIHIPYGKYKRIFSDTLEHFAIVDDGINGIFAIDRNEKKLFSVYIIDNGPDEIKSGLFRITENDKIGFADFNGDIIIKPKYEFVFPFVGGIAPFCEGCYLLSDTVTHEYTYYAGGKWGLINRQGIIVYKPQFDSISFDKKGNRYLLYVSDEAFLLNGKLELIKFTRE